MENVSKKKYVQLYYCKGGNCLTPYKNVLKGLQIPLTKFEKVYNLLTLGIVLLATAIIIFNWHKVPAMIPTHYDALGRVDDEGSKWLILIYPLLTLSILSVTKLFLKHPEWGNYPQRVNEENIVHFYLINRQLLTAINNGIIILFVFVALEMVLVGMQLIPSFINLGTIALVIIILFFVPMLIFAFKARKIK